MYKKTNMIMNNPIYLLSKNNATAVFPHIKNTYTVLLLIMMYIFSKISTYSFAFYKSFGT